VDPAAPAPGAALPAGPWLVTGAAGFLGAHTCRRLLAEGCEVVGVDALSTYSDPRLKEGRLALLRGMPGFSFHELDCADEEAVHLLVSQRRPPLVVHLAAQAGVRYSARNPRAYVHSNLVAFGVVLEACRQHDVAHLVYASSSSVYGATAAAGHGDRSADRPVSLYAATKRADELMAHAYSHQFGLPVTGLRLFTAYGPWGRPASSAAVKA
jgi:UDP-glucuronate 4-epimerase